jgi:hypothetical protein
MALSLQKTSFGDGRSFACQPKASDCRPVYRLKKVTAAA